MTDKQLSKLNRRELLEILVEQEKENVELRQALESAKAQALNIKPLTQSSNITEASIALNSAFSTVQAAVNDYLEKYRNSEEDCKDMIEKAKKESERIINEAVRAAEEKENKARENSAKFWKELSDKLEKFYSDHRGLRDMLKTLE